MNVTISELSFVPTTEDDGKEVTCRAENPSVQGMYMEDKWKIDVVCEYKYCFINIILFIRTIKIA